MEQPIFKAGKKYRIRSQTVKVSRVVMRPGYDGETHELLMSGNELAMYITGENGREYCFMDGRCLPEGVTVEAEKVVTVKDQWSSGGSHTYTSTASIKPNFTLQDLEQSFNIPTVPDVAVVNPQGYQRNLQILDEIERRIKIQCENPNWRLKQFQRRDLSRAALHDGVILAWMTGLGKSIAAICWPVLKVGFDPSDQDGFTPAKPCLLVAPENLHAQLAEEFKVIFGIELIELDSQDTYRRLAPLKNGWYVSSFTQIARNQVKKMPEVPASSGLANKELTELMNFYGVKISDAKADQSKDNKGEPLPIHEKALKLCRQRRMLYSSGVGEEQKGIHCIYSPSLADYIRYEFACVTVDEAVHIKSEDSLIGIGVRSLSPKFRCCLTATPVKNRLPDIFFLSWWVCGASKEAHARWPYGDSTKEFERFQEQFLVYRRDLTKEKAEAVQKGNRHYNWRRSKRKGSATAEVCQIHKMWKLFAPIILRRRKQDAGEEIVPKIHHIVTCPLGLEQSKVYAYHLKAIYEDRNQKDSLLSKLQALRSCAAAPNSDLLLRKPQPDESLTVFRSEFDYIPRMAACLTIIEQCLSRGEQVAIGSAFHEPLDALSRRLREAGIPHDVLDGRVNAGKRGIASKEFKLGIKGGGKPVLLAGMGSMSEGNNWFRTRNTVLYNQTWAWDEIEQWINRVHRMTSEFPVNVYSIIADGTIDLRLDSLRAEKGDSQELVLDGKLMGEHADDVDFVGLLNLAYSEYENRKVLDERECERAWPELRSKLRSAYANLLSGKTEDAKCSESPAVIVANALREPIIKLAPVMPIRFRSNSLFRVS